MANPEHLAILDKGVDAWNRWRLDDEAKPDLSNAQLKGAQLEEIDLRGANLAHANLRRASLRRAQLDKATMTRANLTWSNLLEASLMEVDLQGANMSWSWLVLANATGANLRMANLRGVSARMCNLTAADLTGTDLRESRMEYAVLHAATLNGTRLWRTDTYNWNITAVTCSSAYWDKEATELVTYDPGKFEKEFRYWPEVTLDMEKRSAFYLLALAELLVRKNRPEAAAQLRFKRLENDNGAYRIVFQIVGKVEGPDADEIRHRVETARKIVLDDSLLTRLLHGASMRIHHAVREMSMRPELFWDESATPPPMPQPPMAPPLAGEKGETEEKE